MAGATVRAQAPAGASAPSARHLERDAAPGGGVGDAALAGLPQFGGSSRPTDAIASTTSSGGIGDVMPANANCAEATAWTE